MKLQYIVRRYTSEVELLKDEQCPLGISVTASQKERGRPTITNIKHGSVAHNSHCLAEGDVILSVRGMDTRGMSKKEVKRFFKDSNPQLDMKVEYITREASFGYCRVYCSQRMFLTLRKINGTFGFVLRKNSGFMEYPVISNIKQGSPVDRDGIIMAGDRLLEVDNQSLSWISLPDVVSLLKNKEEAIFLFEYNVGMIDLSREKETHLEVTCPDTDLGMKVDSDDTQKMFISFIQQGSLAQRCGVFHVGDEILTINGIDVKNMTSTKANDLLRRFRKGSGKLTFLHKGENDKLGTSVCQATPNIVRSSPTFSSPIFVPPNSFASFYYDPIPEDVFFKSMENSKNHNDYQLEIMTHLKDIQIHADKILLNLSSKHSDIISDTSFPTHETLNADESYQSDENSELATLKGQVYKLMKQTRSLIIYVLKNSAHINHDFDHSARVEIQPKGGSFGDELKFNFIDSLNEFANRRLVSKSSVKKLIATAVDINKNCRMCVNEFYAASFAIRKVHLLLSLNNTTLQEFDTIRHVLKRVCHLPFPCYYCKIPSSAGSTSETQASQSVQRVKNSSIPPRTFGVGASSSSTGSTKETPGETSSASGSQKHSEPHVGLNLSQQTVLYRLTRNEKTSSQTTNSESFRLSAGRNDSPSSSKTTEQSSSARFHQDAINCRIYNDLRMRRNPDACGDDILLKPNRALATLSNSTLTSLTEADKQRALLKEEEPSLHSVNPKYAFERQSTPLRPSFRKVLCRYKSSMGFDVPNEDPPQTAGSSNIADPTTPAEHNLNRTSLKIHHTDAHEVLLKAESGSFGFIFGYNSLLADDGNRVPIISAIKPKSAAHKCGLLKKGDRILALNGFSTVGIAINDLESLKRETFNFDEVVLTVEFDIMDADKTWGTFTLQLETSLKLGLVMDEPKYPQFVRGVVKGSSAHRSGQLFPGDEILSFSTMNEETLNLQTWTTRKTKIHHLTVRREQNTELHKKEARNRQYDFPFDPVSFVRSGSNFEIKRTSIRTMEGVEGSKDKMVLEQEFTLFRDPLTWDFGFLFGENPQTGNAYITDIRPGGPADHSRVIKKYDRIIEVNGVLVDNTAENSVMALFLQTDDRVNLVTRRVLHYR